MSKNIVLVGLSGTGKTTVGHILKTKLKHFSFVDTDKMIVDTQKCSINDIFANEGEQRFRELETIAAKKAAKSEDCIISTGGGIILKEENMIALSRSGVVFYLKTSPDVLIRRLENDTSRPLLNTDNIKSKLISMLAERENLYKKADFTIVTDDLTPEQTADEIVRIYNEKC